MFELIALKLTGRELLARGPAWALASVGLVSLLLGVFVLLDAWRSRVSAGAIAVVALLYGGAIYFTLFAPPATTMAAVMIASSVTLVAHLSLLVALLLYARHVLLESRGLIVAKPKKKRTPKPKAAKKLVKEKVVKPTKVDDDEVEEEEDEPEPEAKKSDRIIKIDPPHNKNTASASISNKTVTTPVKIEAKTEAKKEEPAAKQPGPLSRLIGFGRKPAETPPPAAKTTSTKPVVDDDDDDDDDDSPSGSQRMSKAEKRRLKKLKRREANA
jgi:hypothetical protein